jgi:serine protease Do
VQVPIPNVGPFRPGDFIPRGVLRGDIETDQFGSGFVIDADRGIVVTTAAVLRGSSQVMVIFADGTERMASQFRRDPRSEVAVLLVDAKGVNAVAAAWADSNALEPGDWVLALGSAGGSAPSMSAGIFSARRRGSGPVAGDEWLETDTRFSPSNLGGPLVNLKGEVLGLASAGPGSPRDPAAMNHVLPANRVRRIAGDLTTFGQVRRPYLGVQIEPIELSPGTPGSAGAVTISSVGAGTPAAAAGLQTGDRIKSAGGRPLTGIAQLLAAVEDTPIGEELTLLIDRNGQRIEVKVRPQAQPAGAEAGGLLRSRLEGENRRDPARERPRSRIVAPPNPVPQPAKPQDGSEPSDLEPIPPRDLSPAPGPAVPPEPQPQGSAP